MSTTLVPPPTVLSGTRPGLRLRFSAPMAVVGGGLLALAFPRTSIRPLAVVAVAILSLATRRQSAPRGLVTGAAFGLAFFVPMIAWLQHVGTHAWLALSILEALFFALLGGALALLSRAPLWWLWSAGAWVAEESLRGRLPFGGFTWGRLGFSQDTGPFTRWVAIGGVPLVTFVVALVGTLLAVALLWLRVGGGMFARRRGAGLAAGLAAAALAAGGGVLPSHSAAGPGAVVAVVQGNVPRLGLGFNEQRLAVTTNHRDATLALARRIASGEVPEPRFVIWPENATDVDPRVEADYRALVEEAVQAVHRPLLVGGILDSPAGAQNAGLVWDPVTGPGADPQHVYVKRHLVPFGEYVPLRSLLQPLSDRLQLVGRGFVAGHRPGVLSMDGVAVGDVICFEVAYDALVRDVVDAGAQLLVVQTNNATYEPGDETYQQLAMARMRAIEHDRTVLVAATSGVSAIIAPDGTILARAPIFTQDALVRSVPLRTTRTLADRLGDLPELVLGLLGVLPLLVVVLTSRRLRMSGPTRRRRRRSVVAP